MLEGELDEAATTAAIAATKGQTLSVEVIFLSWVMEPVGGHKGPPQRKISSR
jgi:hypothetical protein